MAIVYGLGRPKVRYYSTVPILIDLTCLSNPFSNHLSGRFPYPLMFKFFMIIVDDVNRNRTRERTRCWEYSIRTANWSITFEPRNFTNSRIPRGLISRIVGDNLSIQIIQTLLSEILLQIEVSSSQLSQFPIPEKS